MSGTFAIAIGLTESGRLLYDDGVVLVVLLRKHRAMFRRPGPVGSHENAYQPRCALLQRGCARQRGRVLRASPIFISIVALSYNGRFDVGIWSKILALFDRGHKLDELARRLDVPVEELQQFEPVYRNFVIAKRNGGRRQINAPIPELKSLQRRILRRLLTRLKVHPAATGFQRGESFVTNARRHQGSALVVQVDVKDFFPAISTQRVKQYFRRIGWSRAATEVLVKLCTWEGSLPQGAPTSPRLSNLVNYRLDARLDGLATAAGATYSRYADDLTFSFRIDRKRNVDLFLKRVRQIAADEGYQLHKRKKLHVRRRHQRQEVTGLVVNDGVNLPREKRRWLRAVQHRADMSGADGLSSDYRALAKRPTLSPEQLDGWRALERMIEKQSQ